MTQFHSYSSGSRLLDPFHYIYSPFTTHTEGQGASRLPNPVYTQYTKHPVVTKVKGIGHTIAKIKST